VDAITIAAVVTVGATVGFLGGMFGKGGSAIATPLLHLAGLPAVVAVASPLPSTVPATLVASSAYQREDLVRWRLVWASVAVGMPAAALGAFATRWIGGEALVVATEIVIVVLGLRFLVHPTSFGAETIAVPAWRLRVLLVAAVVGFVSGLLANGGGFLLAPLYVLVLRIPLKHAFGTSLVVAAFLAIPGTIVHAALGHIDWAIVGLFAVSAIPLSLLGSRVAVRTTSSSLERWYGAGLAVIGLATLFT
jgi:uncharacterized membrane protein YfcA